MSPTQFITRSLVHHWRIHAAVALGVAAATAVLAGALLVGDSVRGSLRRLTIERLGHIDHVLVTDRFFRAELADELARRDGFETHFSQAAPAILFPKTTVELPSDSGTQRSSNVTVIASDESFWQLDATGQRPTAFPGTDEVVLNEPLANELGAQVGDLVTLRLPSADEVPADSPLASKQDRVRGVPRLTVVAIVPADGLGRFSMRASQMVPRNVYLSLDTIQQALGQEERINAVLIGGRAIMPPRGDEAAAAETWLADALRPMFVDGEQVDGLRFEDFGLRLSRVQRDFTAEGQTQTVFDYYSLTTDRMLFAPAAAQAIEQAVGRYDGQPVFTYLATTIAKVDGDAVGDGIPYSLITAVDSTPAFDLLAAADTGQQPLADDEILLNQWAAEDLDARLGDTIRVEFFEPETTHGEAVSRSADFTLRGILPLVEPVEPYDRRRQAVFDEPPSVVNDPDLTPLVEGFTDQRTVREANPPFPFDRDRIRPQDDEYWDYHRTTPKAFISLERGEQLWGSRFGSVTSFRIPASERLTEETLRRRVVEHLSRDSEALGYEFVPVKQRQLAASAGTTPFDALFIALSFFVIVAALMLVALLFRLGLEQRAAELGTLLAMGIDRRRATRWFIAEGTCVAAVGALVGVGLGMGYAWLMLAGLRSWWVGAIVTPFLEFHYTPRSLVLGWTLGVLACVATIAWSTRHARKVSVRQLLAGRWQASGAGTKKTRRAVTIAAVGLLCIAVGLAYAATGLGGEAQAGAFVGAGAAVLLAALLLVWNRLRGTSALAAGGAGLGMGRLAGSNARRNPSRSTLSIGLIAAASFLIVAMSAFQLDPSLAGAGGFNLYAESSGPIFVNLNDPAVREELLADQSHVLDETRVLSLRVKSGDDASCTNLYRPTQPRVFGVPQTMIDYYDQDDVRHFSWAATAADSDAERKNPWRLLDAPPADGAVPVVIDKATAMYSLQMYGGVGEEMTFVYDSGATLRVRVVGLLSNSIFQGGLLIGERNFRRVFPDVQGYNYFLIETPEATERMVTEALENRLGDEGFDVRDTQTLLAQLLAVQNTYLKTFQALGALGLLLGTFGLATVQLRSVLERRGELALLRATGFRRRRLAGMVMLENVLLLLGGLATGVLAALVAVLPHMVLGEAAVPAVALFVMLGLVVIVGVASGLAGVIATLRAPLVSALRGD